jgi:hypothetical protein
MTGVFIAQGANGMTIKTSPLARLLAENQDKPQLIRPNRMRERGCRLEAGELAEIQAAAERGQTPSVDQVLGLLEAIRDLNARCARRFEEALDLRDQVDRLTERLNEQLSEQLKELPQG